MKKIIAILSGLLILSWISTVVSADQIEQGIVAGLDAYKEKEYNKAIRSLEAAAQEIREMKASRIKGIFPEPLPGWSADEAESIAIGSIFAGGAISGSRIYSQGDSTIKIDIVSDSPFISIVTSMISNPVMAQISPLMKIINIKGRDAVSEWNNAQQSGNIKVVASEKVLVTVSGENCRKEDIFAYADVIDYRKIDELTSS